MPKLALETIDVPTKHDAGLVQLLHCVHRPRSARERLGVDRNRNAFDNSYSPINIVCGSDTAESEGEKGLESVVRLFGFVDPCRQPSYNVAADGITTGRISGDDEPPMEGLMDGGVSGFGGAAPEGDVDSSALHRAHEMPDGRERAGNR